MIMSNDIDMITSNKPYRTILLFYMAHDGITSHYAGIGTYTRSYLDFVSYSSFYINNHLIEEYGVSKNILIPSMSGLNLNSTRYKRFSQRYIASRLKNMEFRRSPFSLYSRKTRAIQRLCGDNQTL